MNKNNSSEDIPSLREELQASQQILKAICDSTKSSIFLVAPDFRILFFNKWASDGCKLLYGREMFVGDSILNYREPDDESVGADFKEDFDRAIQTKTLVVREREMQHPGMRYWVRLEYTPVYDGHELIGVLVNVLNISDRKK